MDCVTIVSIGKVVDYFLKVEATVNLLLLPWQN